MLKDLEIKGEGNSYDFGARMQDPRLGKWFSIDALRAKFPFASPYNFALNSPILFKDIDGNDIFPSASFMANKNLATAYKALLNAPTSRETLSKFASNRTPISPYGKDGVLSKTMDIVLTSYKGSESSYAETTFYAVAGDGTRYNLQSLADFAAIPANQLNKDTKFVVEIGFNEIHTDKLDETLESAIHEFAIHFDDAVPVFEDLKSGKIDGKQFKAQWEKMNKFGNELNESTQHSEIASASDNSYNKITAEIKSILVNKKDKEAFSKKGSDEKARYEVLYPQESDKKATPVIKK